MKTNKQSGQSMIEILVAISILSVVLVLFVSTLVNLSNSRLNAKAISDATQHAREGLEVAYNLGATDWESFSSLEKNRQYYPAAVYRNGKEVYEFQEGTETLHGKFTRYVTIEHAKRDPGTRNLSETGYTDPNTLLVKSTVTWELGEEPENIELMLYITDFRE